jgi:hypothetical protein
MKSKSRDRFAQWSARLIGVAALALCAFAMPAAALTISSTDSATLSSVTGTQVGTMTSVYDFDPVAGGDGTITSTVYEGIGAAEGYYVYTYEIELYDSTQASIGAIVGVTFEFSATPASVTGIGEAFYVSDGTGSIAPDLAIYNETTKTAAFRFDGYIGSGETSYVFGLFSPNAPLASDAQLIDGGALGGTASVLSNGVAAVPEPSAALVFALGFVTIAARCRTKR